MKFHNMLAVGVLGALFLGGCATAPEWDDSSTPRGTIWDSNGEEAPRPEWISTRAPGGADGNLYFVGLSSAAVDEATAEADAIENAKSQIADYIGEVYNEQTNRAEDRFGLRSEGIDPTDISHAMQTTMQEVLLRRQIATDTYYELRREPMGDQWYAFVRTVWDESSHDAVNDAVERTIEELREEAKARAVEQSELVDQYFNSIESGVTDAPLRDLLID